jgi:hypothetical protein
LRLAFGPNSNNKPVMLGYHILQWKGTCTIVLSTVISSGPYDTAASVAIDILAS